MLPKFATNLFGHFPRSSGAAFRNGFFNSSQGPSAGGAKYNAGSRFSTHSGYNGAGRAITQASALGDDDRHPRLQRLSLLPRQPGSLVSPGIQYRLSRVRGNSTSAAVGASSSAEVKPHHAAETINAAEMAESDSAGSGGVSSPTPSIDDITNPAAPQSVLEPQLPGPQELELDSLAKIEEAYATGSYEAVSEAASNFTSTCKRPTAKNYNHVLGRLFITYRNSVQAARSKPSTSSPVSIIPILNVYNDMISKNVYPNPGIFNMVILALCMRDDEVQKQIVKLDTQIKRKSLLGLTTSKAINDTPSDLFPFTPPTPSESESELTNLSSEKNFNSALSLFAAASKPLSFSATSKALPPPLDTRTYCWLLHACASHKAVDAAIRIFAHFERYSKQLPPPWMYEELISVYASTRDLVGAREVFEEFRSLSKQAKIRFVEIGNDFTHGKFADEESGRSGSARLAQVGVWNAIMGAHFRCVPADPGGAIGLLEEMLDTPNNSSYTAAEPPLPSQETYARIIKGFLVDLKDTPTALSWFEQMLKNDFVPRHEMEPCAKPPRPSASTWRVIFDHLSAHPTKENVEKLFEYWTIFQGDGKILKVRDNTGVFALRTIERVSLIRALISYIRNSKSPAPGTPTDTVTSPLDPAEKKEKVTWLLSLFKLTDWEDSEAAIPVLTPTGTEILSLLVPLLVEVDECTRALDVTISYSRALGSQINPKDSRVPPLEREAIRLQFDGVLENLLPVIFSSSSAERGFTISQILEITGALYEVNLISAPSAEAVLRRLYTSERSRGVIPNLSPRLWSELIFQLTHRFSVSGGALPKQDETENPFDVIQFVKDFASTKIPLQDIRATCLRLMLFAIYTNLGETEGKNFITSLEPHMAELLRINIGQLKFHQDKPVSAEEPFTRNPAPQDYAVSPSSSDQSIAAEQRAREHFVIDDELSRSIDEYYPVHRTLTPYDGLKRLEKGLDQGLYPRPEVIGRLINTLGRAKQLDTVKRLYSLAQSALLTPVMEANRQEQSLAWFQVEDHMIIALAHGGDVDAAHNHRLRILTQGGAPSSDAYGALISGIKDSTDDVQYALSLWHESQERGVIPNLFLYNTIISRLAKGRKAEQALELFQQMKTQRINPSTITYGAVITACCRVSDVVSAETLFEEMTRAKKYAPRVPPFNSIMQLFVTMKPDREKVLEYYGKMTAAGVRPSDHTYKLLLDAYGSVQPIDLQGMESVFKDLLNDRRVSVNGTHWAARINAYGCVNRDLEKAMSVFDEIPSSHSAKSSTIPLPDPICFEAIINVLATHHRTDLFPVYIDRLNKLGVRMTAYINNIMIKGYAITGDIQRAREVFESMTDPAFGIAASDNHAPHEPPAATGVPLDAPVYREPSTWEAMVRAELGQSNKQQALALISRMRTRGYPSAVLNRVEGILQDDAIPPSTDDTPTSTSPSDTGFSQPPSSGISTPPSSLF